MLKQNYSSTLLEEAVDEFASLPGVGRKTALRLALHLLKQPQEKVVKFSNAFIKLRSEVKYCRVCNMISDSDICPICSNMQRDRGIVCVVETVRDVISIERTEQYNGLYHVLGGIISPMDGVGPNDIFIDSLVSRVESGQINEVIIALSTGMEGETTAFYIYKKLAQFNIKISSIARGVGFGDDLEYADELTLGRSILNRQPYRNT